MADNTQVNVKPLQRISADEKIANSYKFFKDTADYYIGKASFDSVAPTEGNDVRSKKMLYEIYNNQIPLKFFEHHTNPYNTEKSEYQKWPAKIRPTTILRTNIDQLQSEYPKRPFSYYVANLGDGAYNAYLDGLQGMISQTLQRRMLQVAEKEIQQNGGSLGDTAEQIAQEQIPMPDEVASAFKNTYKDNLAISGQKKMNRIMAEQSVRQKLGKMFKDWLISGEAVSYKGIHNGALKYNQVSPLLYDGDNSVEYGEDGEWGVAMYPMTYSAMVDEFYDDLKESDHIKLENGNALNSPKMFFDYLKGVYTGREGEDGTVSVYHVVWKGKQKMWKIKSTDPLTGEETVDYLDEAYKPEPGEKASEVWVNCVYETWRLSNDIYLRTRETLNQRSQMNNFSYCKLPYNRAMFSNTHAQNLSVLEIGLPFQIMYMVVTRSLELTIARSKGKIVLLDKNVIPSKNGWDEDKFFYYAEALGYGLIDRNQVGVDKSFNQYQVLDLTMYDSIKQLIELQQHLKNEWDSILGFSRQRKGQTYATETAESNSEAIFQSTVITDMIFIGFENFVEKDLNALLDLSKFTDLDGVRKLYNESEVDHVLMEIDGNQYMMSELGLFFTKQEHEKLRKIQGYAGMFAQNGAKASTVLELLTNDNIAMMKSTIRKAEDAEAQAAQAQAQSEQEREQMIEEIRNRYEETARMFDKEFMEAEYDRKEAIEHIKGEYALHRNRDLNDGDNNDNGIADATEIFARANERTSMHYQDRQKREEVSQKERQHKNDLLQRAKELESKNKLEKSKQQSENIRHNKELAMRNAELKAKERIEQLKARTALANKVPGEKK